MIKIKTLEEIDGIRKSCHLTADMFNELLPKIKAGMSTYDIDMLFKHFIESHGGTPAWYVEDFPGAVCISINEEVIHGIPSKKIKLKEGDIVSLDVVANLKGYCADATRTFIVGTCKENVRRILDVCTKAFYEGVKQAKPGNRVGDISAAIQHYVESSGYSVAREFTGHGIGKSMHEDPSVPNYGIAGTGALLQKGMAIAVEPMILEGKKDTRILGDGWTVKSKDGKLTCHYENTIVITEDGYEIITLTEGEKNINV